MVMATHPEANGFEGEATAGASMRVTAHREPRPTNLGQLALTAFPEQAASPHSEDGSCFGMASNFDLAL